MALTALAAGLLVGFIVPGQRRVLDQITESDDLSKIAIYGQLRRLASVTGVFALLWVVVTVLMIVRPGSTTGVA